jgi:basic membrane protein A
LFHDEEWGRTTALLAVEDGADIVFSVGEETAEAAMAAAASRGALVIGAETDQYLDVPKIRPQLLTSAILDVRAGVLELLRESTESMYGGGEFPGGVALAPFHDYEGRIPPEVRTRLQEIAGALERDEIRVDAIR